MKDEKKLLKGLKTKYFHFIMMKIMKNKSKQKKKKTNFPNILRINQKVSAMICLKSILILKHLLS